MNYENTKERPGDEWIRPEKNSFFLMIRQFEKSSGTTVYELGQERTIDEVLHAVSSGKLTLDTLSKDQKALFESALRGELDPGPYINHFEHNAATDKRRILVEELRSDEVMEQKFLDALVETREIEYHTGEDHLRVHPSAQVPGPESSLSMSADRFFDLAGSDTLSTGWIIDTLQNSGIKVHVVE